MVNPKDKIVVYSIKFKMLFAITAITNAIMYQLLKLLDQLINWLAVFYMPLDNLAIFTRRKFMTLQKTDIAKIKLAYCFLRHAVAELAA